LPRLGELVSTIAHSSGTEKNQYPLFWAGTAPLQANAGWALPRACLYMWSIITWPKPEQLTCVAPSIKRAKS
jgi:hypothetical protein